MAKKTKKYVHFSVPGGNKAFAEWEAGELLEGANSAFLDGHSKPGKEADTLEELEASKLVLDTTTGNLRVRGSAGDKWFRPGRKCPDCTGRLELKKKFFACGNPKSPWFFLCSNREEAEACKTVIPANVGGSFAADVADAETRRARKLTSEQFDRLWQEAPDILEWAGNPDDRHKVMNTAKARAYRYLAHKAEEEGLTEKNIATMDIPALRVAYRICRDADISEVMTFGK
ncbi:hypothetical protein [Roseivivax sp. CAU 1761]